MPMSLKRRKKGLKRSNHAQKHQKKRIKLGMMLLRSFQIAIVKVIPQQRLKNLSALAKTGLT